MREDIIAYFRIVPAASAEMVASELGLDPREVQNILHELDDTGHLLMRNGFYRLSEAEKNGPGRYDFEHDLDPAQVSRRRNGCTTGSAG